MMSATAVAERINPNDLVFNQRDESTKEIDKQNDLTFSQRLLLHTVNNLVAAYILDEG